LRGWVDTVEYLLNNSNSRVIKNVSSNLTQLQKIELYGEGSPTTSLNIYSNAHNSTPKKL